MQRHPEGSDWPSAGQNNHNTHNAAGEHTINSQNVGKLLPKWVFTTAGDVTATPTVVDGAVFAPDWGGKIWAIDAASGREVWSRSVGDYDGVTHEISRTSPAYWNGQLVIGTGVWGHSNPRGAYVVGVNARTGAELWHTNVDSNPAAIITSSPTIDHGVVYVGVSSQEERFKPPYSFRGSVMALDARTGRVMWRTYTVPEGYTGGAVWGSQPVVDNKTGLLYVGVGNNYGTPPGVCVNPTQVKCQPSSPDNHIDSVLGLNLTTGVIKWSRPTLTADTWTRSDPNGAPDYDFGAAPNLYTTLINGKKTDVLGIGQKSGTYYALEPKTGNVIWKTWVGPGGINGGIHWGAAVDGKRVFVSISNSEQKSYTATSFDGKKTTTKGGFWAALDAATGKILWQTVNPQRRYSADGFVSSANGVMFANSAAPTGNNMYALDAATGKIEWAFASGGPVWSGAAISNGSVYWGSGYARTKHFFGYSGGNNKLYGFSLNVCADMK